MHNLPSYQLAVIALGAIAFGIWLLVKGGNWTVDSAASIAERSGLSKLFIAATIVAFGTSAPELFTSVNANLTGFPSISVGNIMGSNIANVLLVLGAAALIAPIAVDRKEVRVDTIVMIAATALMSMAVVAAILPLWGGLGMLVCISGYVLYQYKASKIDVYENENSKDGPNPFIFVGLGIGALLLGSEVLVQGAVAGGIALGVPEAVIGMTLIALGTSLPELVACIAAARKGQSDMIVGGIVGSNIFNIFSVMAVSAVVRPLIIEPRFVQIDLPIVVGVTAVFAFMLLVSGRFGRVAGGIMLASYVIFTLFQYWETITVL